MAEPPKYPYTTVPAKLRKLLSSAPSMGRPDKVTVAWLKTAGWTSSNDASMIPVLRFVGLVASDGRPTDLWDAVRSPTKENRARFAEDLRSSYAELFALYPDAHRKDAEALRNFFRAHTSGAEQVQAKLVQTFQALVEFGDFDTPRPVAGSAGTTESPADVGAAKRASREHTPASRLGSDVALTVNIQLQLPATADAEVYDKLFASMRTHLMGIASGDS